MINIFYLVAAGHGVPARGLLSADGQFIDGADIEGVRRLTVVEPLQQTSAGGEKAEKVASWVFGDEFPYLGVVEVAVDDLDAWTRVRGEVDRQLTHALGSSVDLTRSSWIATEEHEVIGTRDDVVPGSAIKATFFPRRKKGVAMAEFSRHWREEHAALVPDTPHLVRYVQGHAVDGQVPDGEVPYAGVAQLWWNTIAELEEGCRSKSFLEDQPADAGQFVEAASLYGFLGTEHLIK